MFDIFDLFFFLVPEYDGNMSTSSKERKEGKLGIESLICSSVVCSKFFLASNFFVSPLINFDKAILLLPEFWTHFDESGSLSASLEFFSIFRTPFTLQTFPSGVKRSFLLSQLSEVTLIVSFSTLWKLLHVIDICL